MALEKSISIMIKLLSETIGAAANKQLKDFDLTGTQMMVLYFLHDQRGKEVSLRDIERYFHVKHTTVIGLVNRLEAKGFLNSFTNQTDRRIRNVVLADKGIWVYSHVYQKTQKLEASLLKGLTKQEKEQTQRILSRLYQNMSEPIGE